MLDTLLNAVRSGLEIKYKSYDYHAAMNEANESSDGEYRNFSGLITEELRDKHMIMRTGKVWDISLTSTGELKHFLIGASYMYRKRFYASDIGSDVMIIDKE